MESPNVKIAQLVIGMLHTNCYLVVGGNTGEGMVIDPAVYDDRIPEILEEMEMKSLRYILLTHGHMDHILGVNAVKAKFPEAQIVGPKGDAEFFTDPYLSLAERFGQHQDPIPVDRFVEEGDELPFDKYQIKVVETPGHTDGSSCYLLGDIMFSGDTLFRGSMGITTHPTGDADLERKSLQKLKNLPGDYKVLPGHGALTTLQQERENNIYMRDPNDH